MPRSKWIFTGVLALFLGTIGVAVGPADARREPPPPPPPRLVGAVRVSGPSCGALIGADDSGTVYISQCYAPGFLVAGRLPGIPVSLSVGYDGELYVGLESGDIYRSGWGGPVPWTFEFMGNVFTPATTSQSADPAPESGVSVTGARRSELGRAFPNPVRGGARIEYTTSRSGHVSVRLFDAAGRLMRTLDAVHASPGAYAAIWDGSTDRGSRAPNGVYYYRVTFPDGAEAANKVVLAR